MNAVVLTENKRTQTQKLHKSEQFKCSFTILDIILIAISIGSFITDVGTDIIVIVQYYKGHHFVWASLTLGLVCIPSCIVQVFSLRWYKIDGVISKFLWIIHVLQLGLFNRYFRLLKSGYKAQQSKLLSEFEKFYQEQSDVCMLRLFESFMESAPQLVLQLYIMVSTEDWNPWTGISAVASVLSVSCGIAAYSKAMRSLRPEKQSLSWCGLILQASWRIGTVSSRVMSLVLFAIVYGPWLILVMFLHWLCMTIWVISQKTDFCTTWWEERLYNCIVGSIYCFCFFNLKEGQSRWRMSIFYSFIALQNIGFALVYYFSSVKQDTEAYYKGTVVALVPTGMVIGLSSMLLYYRFFHPSGPIKLCTSSEIETLDEEAAIQINKCSSGYCNLLKTPRKQQRLLPAISFYENDLEQCQIPKETFAESFLSIQSTFTCISDLHRSHSQNCSTTNRNLDNFSCNNYLSPTKGSGIILRKSFANHYRNVNYNFRSAVAFGHQFLKVHCSCLVLNNESFEFEPQNQNLSFNNTCISLPNLKFLRTSQDSNLPYEKETINISSKKIPHDLYFSKVFQKSRSQDLNFYKTT